MQKLIGFFLLLLLLAPFGAVAKENIPDSIPKATTKSLYITSNSNPNVVRRIGVEEKVTIGLKRPYYGNWEFTGRISDIEYGVVELDHELDINIDNISYIKKHTLQGVKMLSGVFLFITAVPITLGAFRALEGLTPYDQELAPTEVNNVVYGLFTGLGMSILQSSLYLIYMGKSPRVGFYDVTFNYHLEVKQDVLRLSDNSPSSDVFNSTAEEITPQAP